MNSHHSRQGVNPNQKQMTMLSGATFNPLTTGGQSP